MAIQIIREVSADVIKRGTTRNVYAKQNDINSRFLNIRIQADGKDIEIDSTSTVVLNVERPDKQENMFRGEVNEDGTIKVPLTQWMLEKEGTLLCDVSIIAEDPTIARLTTMQFNIYVEAAVVSDGSFVETEEYSIIVDLLHRTTEAEKIASEAAKSADYLKERCEKAAVDAEKAAEEASKVREEVEAGGYIESLKEVNKGKKFTFWVGTRAEYEAIGLKDPYTTYIITDDDDLEAMLTWHKNVLAGTQSVPLANKADILRRSTSFRPIYVDLNVNIYAAKVDLLADHPNGGLFLFGIRDTVSYYTALMWVPKTTANYNDGCNYSTPFGHDQSVSGSSGEFGDYGDRGAAMLEYDQAAKTLRVVEANSEMNKVYGNFKVYYTCIGEFPWVFGKE